MMNRLCPKCRRSKLVTRTLKATGTNVDVCHECSGVWFDKNELEESLRLTPRELALPDEAKLTIRRCPACAACLYQFDYPKTYVEIDLCIECQGIWLDAGEVKELATVRAYIEHEIKTIESLKPPAHPIKNFILRFLDKFLGNTTKLSDEYDR